jgi:cytochrome b pre-mRNA-processing protein 3
MLNAIRRSAATRALSGRLEKQISARSRAPVFYSAFGVADSIDGRFDMLTLHAALVLERLDATPGARDLAQSLVDAIFVSFDEGLRQLGAGDVGMSRRMKKMAEAFFGRVQAYRDARDATALESVIARNIFRGQETATVSALANYVVSARKHLETADPNEGTLDFGPLPIPQENIAL